MIGEAVFLIGGCPDVTDLSRCSNAVWKRDHPDSEWKQVSASFAPLAMAGVAAHNASIYVFGGCRMQSGVVHNFNEAHCFRTDTGTWNRLPDLPKAIRGMTAVTIPEGILLIGGYTDAGFSKDVLLFDVEAQAYRDASALPLPLLAPAAVWDGHFLYVAGGEDKMRSRSAQLFAAEIFH